jgi:hypothetical protein
MRRCALVKASALLVCASADALAQTAVDSEEGRLVAGTEGDPVKVAYDLPGVARPALATGQLIVWGAGPEDTRTYVDGVEIPALFHGPAVRSTVNGDLVRRVTLTPGAYGVETGRGLGGTVWVETRDLPSSGVHGYAGADALDGSALVSAAAGDRVRLAAAGRYGWFDEYLRALDVVDVSTVFPVPRYGDYQAKAQVDLGGGKLDAVFLGADDEFTATTPNPDPSFRQSTTTGASFQRFYLRYRRALQGGSSLEVTPWIGHEDSTFRESTGATPLAKLDSSSWRGGLRATYRSRLASWLGTTLGLDVDATAARLSRVGSPEIPAREGDFPLFNRPPALPVLGDSWEVGIGDVAPYAQVDLFAGPLLVSPGVRADGFLMTTSSLPPAPLGIDRSHLEIAIEPRLSARLRLSERLSFFGGAGFYSQPPNPADLSAAFGNPTLGPAWAEHVTVGEALELTETLSAEVVGFAKWMADLAVRNPTLTPPLAQVLLPVGAGRSYGIQVFLRQRLWRGLSGWLAYTLSRSERQDAPGERWRLFDYDEPHVLAVIANQALGDWAFGVRLRVASGLPRTPVVGSVIDTTSNNFVPIVGAQNSIRLPTFWQLDARVDRQVPLGRGVLLRLYAEALNVADHANTEEYVYSVSFSRRGEVHGLPLLAVAGARVDL